MKIVRLTIHNIASISDADIDFVSGKLGDESIFLICGPTGSGKSTILDAICLALYDKTPRLGSSGRETSLSELGDISPVATQNLLQRGANEGWVRLEFSGNDGKDYIAEWSVSRTMRKNAKKQFNAPVQKLVDRQSNITYTKKTEISEVIKSAIGLDFNQFCRTTMLAQGEFTKFLRSPDSDKASILEKLTGTSEYAAVGRRIFEKAKEKREACNAIERIVNGVTLLTDEEKSELNALLSDAEIESERLSVSIGEKRRSLAAKKEHNRLMEVLRKAQLRFTIAEISYGSEDAVGLREKISLRDRTESPRRALIAIDGIESDLEKLGGVKKQLAERVAMLDKSIAGLKEKHMSLNIRLGELDKKKREISIHDTIIDQSGEIVSQLEKVVEMRAKADCIKNSIPETIRDIENIVAGIDELDKKIKKLEADIADGKTACTVMTDTIESLEPEKTDSDIKLASHNILSADKLLLLSDETSRLENSAKELKGRSNEIDGRLKIIASEKTVLDDKLKMVGKLRSQAQHSYDMALVSVKDTISAIRLSLTEGDNCPVCGSAIKEILPTEDHFKARLKPLKDLLGEINETYESTLRSMDELRQEEISLTRENKRLQSDMRIADIDLAETKHRIDSECDRLGIAVSRDSIEVFRRSMSEKIGKLESRRSRITSLHRKLEIQTKELSGLKDSHSSLSLESANMNRDKAVKEAALNDSRKRENELRLQSDDIEKSVRGKLTFSAEEMGCETIIDAIKELKREKESIVSELSKTEKDESEIASRLVALNSARDAVADMLNVVIEPTDKEISGDTVSFASGLVSDVAAHIALRNDLVARRGKYLETVDEFLSRPDSCTREELRELSDISDDEFMSVRDKADAYRRELEQSRNTCLVIRQQILAHGIPDRRILSISEPELDDMIRELESQLHQVSEETGAIRQKLVTESENRKRYAETMERFRMMDEEAKKWERLSGFIGDSTGNRFRLVAQSIYLERMLHHANFYLRRLQPRYELSCTPGSLCILVRDMFAGGALRSNNSLSGGESFIVSLALALGLAAIHQNGFSVDTLFIDEGFGTLSPDYRSMVIDTLRNLHNMGGRKVGIISHVEELKECIPARIEVSSHGLTSTVKCRPNC